MPKKTTKLKTGKWARTMSIAKMGLSAGAKAAGYAVDRAFSSKDAESRWQAFLLGQAHLVTGELTKLKGTVMKAGQMLSMIGEHFLPPEVNQILSKLRSEAEPVEWVVMEKVARRSLTKEALDQLEIDPEPYAAASVGQVHRATIKATGEQVCLKIQYPGIDKAVDSDVSAVRNLLSLSRLLPKHLEFEPLFDEVKTMLRRELDYHREADETEAYQKLIENDPRYKVPKLYREFSGKRVIATEFMQGEILDRALAESLTAAQKDELGRAVIELFLHEFCIWGCVQTDPHFGNYKVQFDAETGRPILVLLDFGAVRRYPATFLNNYRRFLRAVIHREVDAFVDAASTLGLLSKDEKPATIEALYGFTRLIVEPYLLKGDPGYNPNFMSEDGVYDFAASDLATRVSKRALEIFYILKLRTPNKEIIFFDRKVTGVFITLNTIGPKLPAREILDRFLDASS